MANRKISDLTALTAPATGDLLPIVDISEAAAADKNKKITIEKLFQGIPGNVGIGTSSPNEKLEVAGGIRASGALLTGSANSIAIDYSTNARIVSYGANTSTQGGFVFLGANSNASTSLERLRIDSSGRLLVGTSSAPTGSSSQFSKLAVQGNSANAFGGYFSLGYGSAGTGLSAGADIGTINFTDTGAGQFAQIRCDADAATSAGDFPGRLVFSTTADGASSPTEALRITNDRVLAYNQPTPATYAAAATLTVADLKTAIITYTGTVATLTLPTGTLTEGGFTNIYTNMAFEWSVINTGAGICTIGAGTAHTIVGSGTVAIGDSARFASRRTAANTFVSYRLS